MGFFSGRVTCSRFRITGRSPRQFGEEHLEKLQERAIGKQKTATADGVEVGWIAGDHILDTKFNLAKNIINDTLQFALRIDTLKIPAELLRAYTQIELTGLAEANPSGIPSARQKREARDTARERLEQEAADGRYLKRKSYPMLWDSQSNELLVASNAITVVDRLHPLFEETFRARFEPLGAGKQAFQLAEVHQQTRNLDDCRPAHFVPGVTPAEFAWLPDQDNRDFLGNEFLLWLWFAVEKESETFKLSDGSEVSLMLARNLLLECPRGMTGKETITSDGPTRLPEARRAIQAGKMPRKVGLTLNRHDKQYEFTLHAESLTISGAKMPAPEELEERPRLEERVTSLRHLLETMSLLYEVFTLRRLGAGWSKDLGAMQKWLQLEERRK
jgi:hypothetical protein